MTYQFLCYWSIPDRFAAVTMLRLCAPPFEQVDAVLRRCASCHISSLRGLVPVWIKHDWRTYNERTKIFLGVLSRATDSDFFSTILRQNCRVLNLPSNLRFYLEERDAASRRVETEVLSAISRCPKGKGYYQIEGKKMQIHMPQVVYISCWQTFAIINSKLHWFQPVGCPT